MQYFRRSFTSISKTLPKPVPRTDKFVPISLSVNILLQKVLLIPISRQTDQSIILPLSCVHNLSDLLIAFRSERSDPLASYCSTSGELLHHSLAGDMKAFLDGKVSLATSDGSIYAVDQASVSLLRRQTDDKLASLEKHLEQPRELNDKISRIAERRVLLSRYGLLGYITAELALIIFLTYEVYPKLILDRLGYCRAHHAHAGIRNCNHVFCLWCISPSRVFASEFRRIHQTSSKEEVCKEILL